MGPINPLNSNRINSTRIDTTAATRDTSSISNQPTSKSDLTSALLTDASSGTVSFMMPGQPETQDTIGADNVEKKHMGKTEKGLATAASALGIGGTVIGVFAPPIGGALSVAGAGVDIAVVAYGAKEGYPREAFLYTLAGPLAGPIDRAIPQNLCAKVKNLLTSAA